MNNGNAEEKEHTFKADIKEIVGKKTTEMVILSQRKRWPNHKAETRELSFWIRRDSRPLAKQRPELDSPDGLTAGHLQA